MGLKKVNVENSFLDFIKSYLFFFEVQLNA